MLSSVTWTSAEFHLEVDRSDLQTPAHLEAAEPATGIRGLSFLPAKYVGNAIHEIEVRER